jgi:hypothetical protein
MHKLLPELINLAIKNDIIGSHISDFVIDNYIVSVDISLNPHPAIKSIRLPSDYQINVRLLNILTAHLIFDKLAVPEPLSESFVFLDELRYKILKFVTDLIESPRENISNDKCNLNNQSSAEDEYLLRIPLMKEELKALHMFHSPYKVPRGYTDQEVRLCIYLLPLRRKQIELYPSLFPPVMYPDLFIQSDENISRTEALKKAVFNMLVEIANFQHVSNS